MRSFVFITVLCLTACGQKESGSGASAGSGSATASPPVAQRGSAVGSATASGSATDVGSAATGSGSEPAAPSASDADEVAQIVVHDVGSKALGSQKIEASCVAVSVVPAGEWTVAAARLKDCGDKTARSILWLFKRKGKVKWSEDYVGQPPRCWKGVPPDIAEAVSKLTKIPSC